MPLLLKNDFAGQTAGADVTVTNSATSGTAFSHVNPNAATSTAKYVSLDGKIGVRLTPGDHAMSTRWTITASEGRRMVTRRRFNYPGVLTQNRPIQVHHTSPFGTPATNLGFVQQRANEPQVEIAWGNGNSIPASRVKLDAPGDYWIVFSTISASAEGVSDGVCAMKVYMADGVTPVINEAQKTNPQAPDVFGGLAMTHLHPGSVRWSTATGSGGLTADDMIEPQALFTDDLTAWLGDFDDTRALPKATGLTVLAVTPPTSETANDGTVRVKWDASTDPEAGGYDIGIAPGPAATSGFVLKGTVNAATTEYLVTGLAPVTYTVSVRVRPA